MNFLNSFLPIIEVLLVFGNLKTIYGRGFGDEGYFPNNDYDSQETVDPKIKLALRTLNHAPQWIPDWPDYNGKLGQVSGVALDNAGQLLVFHRAGNQWDATTFTPRHIYQRIGEPPIPDPTILVFNETGDLVDMWGQNLFYMPHGITVDGAGNVWVTDVGLHQVFKFTPNQRQKPALTLGEKFVPGNDDTRFCKPSAVAVLSTGDFFVADGYCNHRIIKFSPEGTIILQWGKREGLRKDPFVFDVPHALTLAGAGAGAVADTQLCVADRERGRVACFRADNGTYVSTYSNWLIGTRLFSVAYSPVHGGRLYVVNGPYGNVPVRGYVIDYKTGRLIQTFAPEGGFSNPHDIVVSPDGVNAYVAELDPRRVCKFVDEGLRNESRLERRPIVVLPVKPTATIEGGGQSAGGSGWGRWARAGWAGAGAGAASLAALAGLALLRARNTGRKGITRRRWEYGHGEFKLRRLLERRRFTRVHSDDSDDEPAPMLPPQPPANA